MNESEGYVDNAFSVLCLHPWFEIESDSSSLDAHLMYGKGHRNHCGGALSCPLAARQHSSFSRFPRENMLHPNSCNNRQSSNYKKL